MKILGSNNGKLGVQSLSNVNTSTTESSDIVVKSIFRKGEVLTNFFFNGSWKKLNLDNNAILTGLSDDETFVQVSTLPHTDKRASAFKLTSKSNNKKSRSYKSDNLANVLLAAELIVAPKNADGTIAIKGFVEGYSYSQHLNLVEVERTEEEIEQGIIKAYKVVASEIPSVLEKTREIPQERIDAIMAARAVTLAAKKANTVVEPTNRPVESNDVTANFEDNQSA
jgi:hypothetical protein